MNIKTVLAAAGAACALTLGAGTYYVDYENGNDSTDGTAEGTGAWKTLAHAVGEAAADSEIVLATGTHLLSANITVNKALTIRGSGAKEETILSGDTNWRSITVAAAGCLFHSFTLPGATSVEAKEVCLWVNSGCASVVSNVVLRPIGTTTDCLPASPTIRVAAGMLTHLWATNCFANRSLIQISGSSAVMENSYVADCASKGGQYEDAGLVMVWNCKPTIRNCTIVRNRIGNGYSAIGGDWSRNAFFLQNCIVFHNVGYSDATLRADVTQPTTSTANFVNNCTGVIDGWSGTGNFTDDPMLQSDGRHVLFASKCNHGADAVTATAYDIEGNLRTADGANPSIGAFEYVAPATLSCGISADSLAVSLPATMTLTCEAEGASGAVSYAWDVDGDGIVDGDGKTYVLDAPGIYSPKVTVTAGGTSATVTYGGSLAVHAEGSARYFVDYDLGNDANSGMASDRAWKTLAAAVENAIVYPGDVIELSRGMHHLSRNANVKKDVTIRGAGEKEETILVGDGDARSISLMASGSEIHSVTLAGMKSGSVMPVKLVLSEGSAASNLVIRAVGENPVAAVAELLSVSKARVSCLWATNVVCNSYFAYITGDTKTVIENSYVANITVNGGAYESAGLFMGKYFSGYIRNCTIVDNRIGNGYAALQFWGSSGQRLCNSIIWNNTKLGEPETLVNVHSSLADSTYCVNNCTKPVTGWKGSGNFSDDPGFQDDRMHFAGGSKCNHGADAQTATEYDIEGTLRTKDGANPSVGAFEYVAPQGFSCIIVPSTLLGRQPAGVTLTCSFDGTPTGELSYEWDFDGDGNPDSDEASPAIADIGIYTPSVTVLDEAGHSASSTYDGVVCVHAAGATTYYVDYANGNDDNDGASAATAWKTLSAAVAKTSLYDGDELVLAKGDHPMASGASTSKTLTIRGIGKKEETVIYGTVGTVTFGMTGPSSLVHSVTFAGSQGDGYFPPALNFTDTTVSNVLVTSLGGNPKPYVFYMCQLETRGSTLLTHVTVTNCPFGRTFASIRSSATRFENCLIADNRTTDDDWQGFGLLQALSSNPTFRNCTIVNNRLIKSHAISSSGVNLVNNIIWDNVVESAQTTANIATKPNQFICNCTTTNGFDSAAFTGNIEADPLFKDASRGKYALTAGSPCRNAGDDSVVAPGETDLAGNPRIMSRHVDMGCYEKEGPGLMLLVK